MHVWHAFAGWMLRYVGKADRKLLMGFCDDHLHHFTPEGLRYALEKQPDTVRKQYAARLKHIKGGPAPTAPPALAPRALTRAPKSPAKNATTRAAAKRKRGK